MAEHSLSKFSAHAQRDKSGLLEQTRSPNTVTDVATTMAAPSSGKHSGDGMKGADGHAGADTKGL